MITPNTMQQQANSISDIYAKLEQDIFKLLIDAVKDSDWDKINDCSYTENPDRFISRA